MAGFDINSARRIGRTVRRTEVQKEVSNWGPHRRRIGKKKKGVNEYVVNSLRPYFQAQLCRVVSLHEDGDLITVNPYNYGFEDWSENEIDILKPYLLRKSSWNGKTIVYTDGTEIEYDVTSLNGKYQRRATWENENEEEEEEIQEITAPYAVEEHLYYMIDRDGLLFDINTAGRHWAAIEEEEEESS